MPTENPRSLVLVIIVLVGIAGFLVTNDSVLRRTLANSTNPLPDGTPRFTSHTGAPRPSASPEPTCAACHTAAQTGNTLSISGGGVGNTYTPGQTYAMNVNHSFSAGGQWGFQITAIDGSRLKAGQLSSTDGTTATGCAQPTDQNVFPTTFPTPCFTGERYYTFHTTPSTASGWSFQWTAPASDIGPVTFYAASVRGNGNATSTDDATYFATLTLTAAAAAPGAPTANAATSITASSFTANWSSSSGATGYRLDVSTSNTFSSFVSGFSDLDVGNVLSKSVTGLSANTTYFYRVRAYNGGGTSGNSNTITVATLPNAPAAPTANAATSITGTSFTANWSSSSGATGYRLDVSTSNTFSSFVSGFSDLDVGNVLSKSVTGLTANTTYFYRVRAYNTGGTSGNSNTITVNTLPNAPAAPTANAATSITSTSFTANWSSSSGATGYRLDVSTSNTFSSFVSGFSDLDVGNVLSKSVTGLSANTTYFYRVRAYNTGGTSGNSNTITVATLPNAPAAPTANAATSITSTSFTANWSSSSGATGYRLDVSTSNTFSSFVSGFSDLDVGNVLSQSVTGLSANTTYFYRVRAYNTGGTSGNSNTITVATLPNAPAAPTANAATNITSNSFTANWSSSSGATGYRLDVSTSNTFSSFVSGFSDLDVGNVLSQSVTGLSGNTTYFYRVRAYNTGGASGNSNTIGATTLPGAPAAPAANAASSITATSFTANWSSSSGATGYRLDVSTSNTFSSFVSGFSDLDVGNVLSKSVTGLTANTTYFYRVRAYNTGGTSGNSNTITVVTLPNPPGAPTANAATSITATSFTANWSSSGGATGYRLDVSTSNTFSSFVSGFSDLDVGNVLSKSVTGLSANTTYFYRVRAYNTGGTSGNSNTITVTTSMPAPTGPTIFVDGVTGELAALDSVSLVRGPFTLIDNHNFGSDNHTRILFFTTDLGLPQTLTPLTGTLSVQLDSGGPPLPVESVGPNAVIGGSYIVFRLPDGLSPGLHSLAISLNSVSSTNSPTFTISP